MKPPTIPAPRAQLPLRVQRQVAAGQNCRCQCCEATLLQGLFQIVPMRSGPGAPRFVALCWRCEPYGSPQP